MNIHHLALLDPIDGANKTDVFQCSELAWSTGLHDRLEYGSGPFKSNLGRVIYRSRDYNGRYARF